ncbi:MAG: DinB [Acidobacteria bacterium]|jgi:uncharacterized damage-inducible protein DinB|nr:DinB [Acidobacteriota bacterium]
MMKIAEPLVAEFQLEARTTRRMLERLPADRLTWRPHPKSMTLGRLALHLAELPGWGGSILSQDELVIDGGYAPREPASVAEVLETFDRKVTEFAELLGAQDNARMLAPWRMKAGGRVVLEAPRAAMVRSAVLSHVVHHRGQLSVYLRLLDVALPAVYGPTADERGFGG